MVKVLVFGMTNNYGGLESVIMNLYRNIDKKTVHFDFMCKSDDMVCKKELARNGSKIFNVGYRKDGIRIFKNKVANVLKKGGYDVFWFNQCLFFDNFYIKIAKKYNVKKIIIHAHSSANFRSGLQKLLLGLLHKLNKLFSCRYATDYWACSKSAGKFFFPAKILLSNKYKIINNAIDLERFKFNQKIRQEYRKSLGIDDKFVIGYVARLDYKKNQKFAIKLCSELKKHIDCVLLLVGDGNDRNKLVKLSQHFNLSGSIKFLGSRNDIPSLLFSMDEFVLPSLVEGFCLSSLEAQASGLYTLISSNLTDSTLKTQTTEYLPINKMDEWVAKTKKYILANVQNKRTGSIEYLRNLGFDIKRVSAQVTNYFLE